jgi:hypothetical protein
LFKQAQADGRPAEHAYHAIEAGAAKLLPLTSTQIYERRKAQDRAANVAARSGWPTTSR